MQEVNVLKERGQAASKTGRFLMRSAHARLLSQFALGVSTIALVALPGVAAAQDTQTPDAAATVGNPGPSQTDPQAGAVPEGEAGDDIVITG
ncbi:MAG: hypothetical protein ACK4ZY_12420, partial [Sphingomonas sp.]